MSTFPVTSIGHDVTDAQPFPLFFSRYNFPVVVVVELMGEIYTDTEICLPEIEIDGTTVFVLSHKGAIVCADATVPITAAFSAADTGTEYVVNNRTAVNANITIFFFTINKILLVHYWGTTHITHKEAKRDKFFELFSCNTSSNFYQFIRINGTVYGNEIAIPVTTNIIQISLFEVIACNFILIKWSNFCVFSIEINFGI